MALSSEVQMLISVSGYTFSTCTAVCCKSKYGQRQKTTEAAFVYAFPFACAVRNKRIGCILGVTFIIQRVIIKSLCQQVQMRRQVT